MMLKFLYQEFYLGSEITVQLILERRIRVNSMPLISLFMQGIPESICICALTFVLLKIHLQWVRIISLGAVFGITAYLIRFLPLMPVEPTLINLVLLTLAIHSVTRVRLIWILLAVMISATFLILIQIPLSQLVLALFHTTFDRAYSEQPAIWSLSGLPHVLIGFFVALSIGHFNRHREMRDEHHLVGVEADLYDTK